MNKKSRGDKHGRGASNSSSQKQNPKAADAATEIVSSEESSEEDIDNKSTKAQCLVPETSTSCE
jgi:hypothetical protein